MANIEMTCASLRDLKAAQMAAKLEADARARLEKVASRIAVKAAAKANELLETYDKVSEKEKDLGSNPLWAHLSPSQKRKLLASATGSDEKDVAEVTGYVRARGVSREARPSLPPEIPAIMKDGSVKGMIKTDGRISGGLMSIQARSIAHYLENLSK